MSNWKPWSNHPIAVFILTLSALITAVTAVLAFLRPNQALIAEPEVQTSKPENTKPSSQPTPSNIPKVSQNLLLSVSSWEGPYNQTGYEAEEFMQSSSGFSLIVNKTVDAQSNIAYGIQVVSGTPINLTKGERYKIRFSARASQNLPLVIRLGEKTSPWKSSISDKLFSLQESSSFSSFEQEFTALDIKQGSYLHFQLGNAPQGTQVEIRDVKFYKVSS